ncbi:MAG: helix-turn-helix transcriptional regulator [Bacteroidetes bacterium]|jgi:AraC-like DNA-binding protein|nr:helix-turn-helix transcriptional regulator [Bacteroidota bacterium]MBT6686828.1 helix-turn-helix transcriptional regulator [Bacteroidota bacterium]MBT7144157.1 helix-turn-helix transcriptional regulator [Bacteroidota bacterium]MBT7491876.1 helix-turn-helix transcriptional regulator [Bacteroidota bacterium]
MQINYNITAIVDIFGLFQGLILGSLLLIINRRKVKSTTFLGLFILTYSLNFVSDIFQELNIVEQYPNLIMLPFELVWLEFPLFYIYVQKVSIFSNKKTSYWVLYPGIASIVINIILFLQPIQDKVIIEDSLVYLLYELIGFVFSLYIGFLCIKWINKHIKEVKNQFAAIEFKELRWSRLFVIIGLVYVILGLFVFFIIGNEYIITMTSSIINVALLYWVSLRGILQMNVLTLIPNSKEQIIKKDAHKIEIQNAEKPTVITKELLQKIENYVKKEEAFKQSDLTIMDVAKNVKEHPKRISTVINSLLNQNFNSYVNNFRIEKAKELLNSEHHNFSIDGIGKEVGFNSKSTFYGAFKKNTRMTPSRYKNQNKM